MRKNKRAIAFFRRKRLRKIKRIFIKHGLSSVDISYDDQMKYSIKLLAQAFGVPAQLLNIPMENKG